MVRMGRGSRAGLVGGVSGRRRIGRGMPRTRDSASSTCPATATRHDSATEAGRAFEQLSGQNRYAILIASRRQARRDAGTPHRAVRGRRSREA